MLKPLAMLVFKNPNRDLMHMDRLCRRLQERHLTSFVAKGFVPAVMSMAPQMHAVVEKLVSQGDADSLEDLLLMNTCEEEGPYKSHPEWFRMTQSKLTDPDVGSIYLFQWIPAPIDGGRRRPRKSLGELLGSDSLLEFCIRKPDAHPRDN